MVRSNIDSGLLAGPGIWPALVSSASAIDITDRSTMAVGRRARLSRLSAPRPPILGEAWLGYAGLARRSPQGWGARGLPFALPILCLSVERQSEHKQRAGCADQIVGGREDGNPIEEVVDQQQRQQVAEPEHHHERQQSDCIGG